jgi:Protein kinase domain
MATTNKARPAPRLGTSTKHSRALAIKSIPAAIGNDKIYDLSMPVDVGQVFAGYTILRVLGTGGMGAVYLASHPRLPREDALKILPADLTADPEFRARFVREAELAAGLSHPHIVRIHDRGEEGGQFWISMDYVAGTDAARLLHEHYPGGMPQSEVVPIITAVGSALDYAHNRGLLHRDVKPANILLADSDGQPRRVYLADFGIARHIDDAAGLTATNMTLGTVAYAAPEQLKGERIDGRTDQYALACTAFHLLTGKPPYGESNPAVVITRHVSAPPPSIGAVRPDLAALDPVFATAMAKEPSGRFGSCQEFTDQLSRFLNTSGESAVPYPEAVAPRSGKRARVLIGVLGAVALLIAGGVFAAAKLTHKHNPSATGAPAGAPPTPSPAANSGPFTGVYQVHLGDGTTLDGKPGPGSGPMSATFAVRSVCRFSGCVATASMLTGGASLASSSVFDQVDGRWVAVTLDPNQCRGLAADIWEVITLQPGADGKLTGEYRGAAANACNQKRSVTFTRVGDVDVNSLPDPGKLPPRVVSPAEALHGSYHIARTFSSRLAPQQENQAVVTDCLRTGDRCMSYFHSLTSDTPLVFTGGNWVLDIQHPEEVTGCQQLHVKTSAQLPMPQPPQNPITRLTGHGHHEQTGNCAISVDFDETYTRTGD